VSGAASRAAAGATQIRPAPLAGNLRASLDMESGVEGDLQATEAVSSAPLGNASNASLNVPLENATLNAEGGTFEVEDSEAKLAVSPPPPRAEGVNDQPAPIDKLGFT